MDFKSAEKIKNKLKRQFFDLFQKAETEKMDCEAFMTLKLDIMSKAPKNTPQWVKGYMDGYYGHWKQDLICNKLKFKYKYKGKLYSVDSSLGDYYGRYNLTLSDLDNGYSEYGFYWGDNSPWSVTLKGEEDSAKC